MNQTYLNIEMFVIDDGSTDNTKDIVEQYIEKFTKVGKKLKYIYQENLGLPGAINTGLRNISGEYLVWPDADDWYNSDTAIADLVEIFEKSPESVGIVRGLMYYRREKDLNIIRKRVEDNGTYPKKLFEQCMFGSDGWWYAAGCNMVKTEHLFYYYPNREIFWRSYFGQNIQLQFPILYDYDCITINKYIHNILIDRNSDSRKKYSYYENIKRQEGIKKMRIAVLDVTKNMPAYEKEQFIKKINLVFNVRSIIYALNAKEKNDVKFYYLNLYNNYPENAKRFKFQYLLSQIPCGFIIYRCGQFIVHIKRHILKDVK